MRLTSASPMPVPSDLRIEFVEQTKYLLVILRFDPDAVVAHKHDRLAIPIGSLLPDRNVRLRLIAHELAGIVDEILHHFYQPDAITRDHRQTRLQSRSARRAPRCGRAPD